MEDKELTPFVSQDEEKTPEEETKEEETKEESSEE